MLSAFIERDAIEAVDYRCHAMPLAMITGALLMPWFRHDAADT